MISDQKGIKMNGVEYSKDLYVPETADILIVDDNPDNLRLLSEILTEKEYKVRPAASGEMALISIRSSLPDLILLDILMPDLDGYEVCRLLKAEEKTRDVPVIFLSSLIDVDNKVKGFDVGGVDFITKPFHAEEVLARINTHISLTRMHKQLIQARNELEERVLERSADLIKKNEALIKSEEDLKVALEHKNVVLRELYHRTGNSMQLIISMLNISAGSIDSKNIVDVFSAIENRIQSIALVNNMLYRSRNLSKINLKEYIVELYSFLKENYEKKELDVSVDFKLEDVPVLIDAAIPLGLIINEIVSNSFQHAFSDREKGNINIKLERGEASIVKLEISDDGIGAEKNLNIEKTETFGLNMILSLGEDQLHGNIELDTSSGFRFSLTFNNDIFNERV